GAEGLKAAGDIVDVEIILPEGAEEPKGDYELTLGVNDDAADKDAAIYYLNEDKWEEQGGSVDGEHNTISTNVSHFSTYGVFIDETPAGDDEEPTIVVEGDDDKLDNDEEEDDDNILPSTATSTFNWLLGGFMAVVAGAAGLFTRNRKSNRAK